MHKLFTQLSSNSPEYSEDLDNTFVRIKDAAKAQLCRNGKLSLKALSNKIRKELEASMPLYDNEYIEELATVLLHRYILQATKASVKQHARTKYSDSPEDQVITVTSTSGERVITKFKHIATPIVQSKRLDATESAYSAYTSVYDKYAKVLDGRPNKHQP